MQPLVVAERAASATTVDEQVQPWMNGYDYFHNKEFALS
jgi:hypothetical protein